MDEDHRLAMALIEGVLSADAAAIADCFATDARFRALIPPGPVERRGAAAAGEIIARWFADADPLILIDRSVDRVADRLHLAYRLEGTELGNDFTLQQQVYAEVIDGRLNDVILLCSGFRPSGASKRGTP
jgi:hypothetical protein